MYYVEGGATSQNVNPLQLYTASLDTKNIHGERQPIRATSMDAMVISTFQDALREVSINPAFSNERDATVSKL